MICQFTRELCERAMRDDARCAMALRALRYADVTMAQRRAASARERVAGASAEAIR